MTYASVSRPSLALALSGSARGGARCRPAEALRTVPREALMSPDDDRSQPIFIRIQKHLSGVDYPVDKQQLLRTAQDQGAEKDVLDVIKRMEDRTYDSPTDVTKEATNIDDGSKRS
jgi:hypothetical protein